jgi:hypothetical protein
MKAGPAIPSPKPSTLYNATIGETNANAIAKADIVVNSRFITVGAALINNSFVNCGESSESDVVRWR